MNMLSLSQHNGLPQQQYDLLKTPLQLQELIIQRWHCEIVLYYQHLISMVRHNFFAKFKYNLQVGFKATLKYFQKCKVALNPTYRIFIPLLSKCCLISIWNSDIIFLKKLRLQSVHVYSIYMYNEKVNITGLSGQVTW